MAKSVVKSKEAAAAKRGRPSAELTQRRTAHLLEVARSIFVRRGYRATTMDEVASAAGLTKRTLYAWHQDKESLFRACVMAGGERFPLLKLDQQGDLRSALEQYVVALHNELAKEESYGIGMLFVREAHDFPELTAAIKRGYIDYAIKPLADFLRRHGLEEPQSVERTMLFVAMALSPLHNKMLVGLDLPTAEEVRAHAKRSVQIMLNGGRLA